MNRARKENESYENYRKTLSEEEKMLRSYLRGRYIHRSTTGYNGLINGQTYRTPKVNLNELSVESEGGFMHDLEVEEELTKILSRN